MKTLRKAYFFPCTLADVVEGSRSLQSKAHWKLGKPTSNGAGLSSWSFCRRRPLEVHGSEACLKSNTWRGKLFWKARCTHLADLTADFDPMYASKYLESHEEILCNTGKFMRPLRASHHKWLQWTNGHLNMLQLNIPWLLSSQAKQREPPWPTRQWGAKNIFRFCCYMSTFLHFMATS